MSPDQSSTADTSSEDTLQMSPERERDQDRKKRNRQGGRMIGQHMAVDNHNFFPSEEQKKI